MPSVVNDVSGSSSKDVAWDGNQDGDPFEPAAATTTLRSPRQQRPSWLLETGELRPTNEVLSPSRARHGHAHGDRAQVVTDDGSKQNGSWHEVVRTDDDRGDSDGVLPRSSAQARRGHQGSTWDGNAGAAAVQKWARWLGRQVEELLGPKGAAKVQQGSLMVQTHLARIPPNVLAPLARRWRASLAALACLALFVVFASRSSQRSPSHAAMALYRVTSTPPVLSKGQNVARALENFGNNYGYISLLDPYHGRVFNPSILVLPDSVAIESRILVVARGPEDIQDINGERVKWQRLLGLFVIPLVRKPFGLSYLARESALYTLDLPAVRRMPFRRCADPFFDQFIGAEDPRLFFASEGQPLLIYSQTGRSPRICRTVNIIDARVVVPGLKEALSKAGYKAPIVFKEQTDLIRSGQLNIEKNWSPFVGADDALYFHVSLVPQQIYKYVPNMTLRPLLGKLPEQNCITDLIAADSAKTDYHHATQLLRVTLCKRGECVPGPDNTVLLGLIHVKYSPEPYTFYERRAVTWSSKAPYEYLSVSKPLTYSGTNQADPIYTVSISWNHPSSRHGLGLDHGFLGERVIISFGVYDYGSGYIEVIVDDLLADHTMCLRPR